VLAIELLTAAQALDYRLPLRPGRGVEAAHQRVRAVTTHREADYLFQDDLRRIAELLDGRALLDAAGLNAMR
jgi:histidine ammonia-lyase